MITCSITVPVDPVSVNEEVSVSGTFTDQDTVDTHTAGTGVTVLQVTTLLQREMAPSKGRILNPEFTLSMIIADSSRASVTETAETYIVIYDQTGGFITGGGWFDSPSGAYYENPVLTGKADFGFVSKYKKGVTVPEGNTQFKFKTADLKFDSTSYKWAVVNKARMNAWFFGQGTINGSLVPNNEEYRFMIWAMDGNPTPSG